MVINMRKCRIGVVGIGRGSMMWNYCKDADNAELVAICDKWEQGLKRTSKRSSARAGYPTTPITTSS